MQEFLRSPQRLSLHCPPTYLHLHPGFSRFSHPVSPLLVPCRPCRSIPRAQPQSLPASLQSSLCMSGSLEPWRAPDHLSQTQTAPTGPTHYSLRPLQMSSQRRGLTHGTLSPSPSNLLGCKCHLHRPLYTVQRRTGAVCLSLSRHMNENFYILTKYT